MNGTDILTLEAVLGVRHIPTRRVYNLFRKRKRCICGGEIKSAVDPHNPEMWIKEFIVQNEEELEEELQEELEEWNNEIRNTIKMLQEEYQDSAQWLPTGMVISDNGNGNGKQIRMNKMSTLEDILRKIDLTEESKRALIQQIADGVRWLHNTVRCAHNDIKVENILVNEHPEEPNDTKWDIRFIDFDSVSWEDGTNCDAGTSGYRSATLSQTDCTLEDMKAADWYAVCAVALVIWFPSKENCCSLIDAPPENCRPQRRADAVRIPTCIQKNDAYKEALRSANIPFDEPT